MTIKLIKDKFAQFEEINYLKIFLNTKRDRNINNYYSLISL